MSSEESSEGGEDYDDASGDEGRSPGGYLRVRYLAWRSMRLQRLYEAIDEREEVQRIQKPKRGVGRRDRRLGLPKAGNPPPPDGVSRWMVSKRWLKEHQPSDPALAASLKSLIKEDDGAGWHSLSSLGDESDYEDLAALQQVQFQQPNAFQSSQHFAQSQWATEMDSYMGHMSMMQ